MKASPPRIRVAHVTGYLNFGGKENGIVNLVNRLDPDRFECYVITFMPGGMHSQRIDPARCRLIPLGQKHGNDLRYYFRLARAFRRHRIDIAHTHSWGTLVEGLVAARLARVPVLIHGEHGTMMTDTRWHVWVQRLCWGAADQVVSVSEVLRHQLAETIGFPEPRIRVLPNGVDLERFHLRDDRAGIRRRFGLPADGFLIGTVGRLVPVKAYPVLLEAFDKLHRLAPHAHLAIAGDGPLEPELRGWVAEHHLEGRVHFLGFRTDVEDLLGVLDIFALTSDSEGMSNTVLEAMASSVPVVATRVGGTPEIVRDGETGILVPARDSAALASAVLDLQANSDRRRSMGEAGRARVVSEFSLERMVQRYEQLYGEVLGRSRRARPELRPVLAGELASQTSGGERSGGA